MSDNVTPFPGTEALPEKPFEFEKGPLAFCSHDSLRINTHERTITCAGCGAALEPFDYLARCGARIVRAWESHDLMMQQLRELHARVDKLKREERNLKARVKRLAERSDDVVNLRGAKK